MYAVVVVVFFKIAWLFVCFGVSGRNKKAKAPDQTNTILETLILTTSQHIQRGF